MSDQTLAQSSPLKTAAAPHPARKYTLRYKLTWRFRVGWVWARYLVAGRRFGVPELVSFIFENHFFRAIQIREELTALGAILAKLRPERALEIGTARGGTLLLLTRLAGARATMASIDLPGGKFGGGYSDRRGRFYQRFAGRRQHLRLLRGDSHSPRMSERVKAVFGGQPLDYLFIDGDHAYEGVKRDFEMYGPMVREGGIIAFHDIVEGPSECVGGVPRFWSEIKPRYRHREFIEDPHQGGFGIGILYQE